MRRHQIWLRMADPAYEKKLFHFLNHHYGNVMELHRYEEYGAGAAPSGECLFLTDGEEEFGRRIPLTMGSGESAGINLYQSGHAIARQILERAREGEQEKQPIPGDVPSAEMRLPAAAGQGRVLCVYSPVGGSGKTTLSIALALSLVRRGAGKVLYLNLEGASDWPQYFAARTPYNLSDLLYHLLMDSGRVDLRVQVEKMAERQENGVYFIRPCTSFEDLHVLASEELLRVIGILRQVFDWVVCDMNTAFHGVNRTFISESERCFIPSHAYPGARIKIREFLGGLAVCEADAEAWRQKLILLEWGRKKEKEDNIQYHLPEERELFYSKDRLWQMDERSEYFHRVGAILQEVTERGGGLAEKVPTV